MGVSALLAFSCTQGGLRSPTAESLRAGARPGETRSQAVAGRREASKARPASPAEFAADKAAEAPARLQSAVQTGGSVGAGVPDRVTDGAPSGGDFGARDDATVNQMTQTREDARSTFAIDVDTAAYSIARRSLTSERLPTPSLVRVEEFVNFFKYGYEAPSATDELFSIEALGTRSPVDAEKHILRIGIQARHIASAQRKPVNLVFLVDTSGSMSSRDKLDLARRALSHAVDRLDDRDQVAITTYAGGVRLVLPPTSAAHKDEIKRALRNLRSGGGTAMASGMALAYQQAMSMMNGDEVTRIIVCSDGDANIGASSPDSILEAVGRYVERGIRLTTIGFGAGNYKDFMMERLANRGNGNYFYIDSMRQAERVFGRDLFKMLEDVAQDVKIQVEFDADKVRAYRLVGYENRDVADEDFRNDAVDAGEIGAGHQVTALYELVLAEGAQGRLAEVRVRAKRPLGAVAKETSFFVRREHVEAAFADGEPDYRFAVAAMGAAELLRKSPYAQGWTFDRVAQMAQNAGADRDPDRREFVALMHAASRLAAEPIAER